MNKFILAGLAVVIVGLGLLAYGVLTLNVGHDISVNVQNPEAASGDQFTTSRLAQIEWDTGVASGTLASLYNGSGRDRIVTGLNVWVEGLSDLNGTNNDKWLDFRLDAATSTGSAQLANATGTRFVLEYDLASTSNKLLISSTSPGRIGSNPGNVMWPNGTYLNLISNIYATTTFGQFSVSYIIDD